jgi:hypothetical protein
MINYLSQVVGSSFKESGVCLMGIGGLTETMAGSVSGNRLLRRQGCSEEQG